MNLPPVGSDKYDDLMDEARGQVAEEKHERGTCESGCSRCEEQTEKPRPRRVGEPRKPGDWYWTGDTCPECKGETQFRVGEPDDENETYDAERCRICRWIAEFPDDHDTTVRRY